MYIGAGPDGEQVISSTFQSICSCPITLPPSLVPDLLARFSTSEGYNLYPDVAPFFRSLLEATKDVSTHKKETVVGVLTNSDDRVPQILSSFGLLVGPRRYGIPSPRSKQNPDIYHDIDFVALSYDIGFSKPSPEVFHAAKEMVQETYGQDLDCLHVGDDLEKDYHAAKAAGWQSILLDREGEHKDPGISCIRELSQLHQYLAI